MSFETSEGASWPISQALTAENAALKEQIRLFQAEATAHRELPSGDNSTREEHQITRDYLQSILQTTRDGFWMVDMTGRIIDVNDAYCRISECTREEMLTMTATGLDALEEPPDTKVLIKRVAARESETFETRRLRKDGTVYDVEASVTYLNWHGGMVTVYSEPGHGTTFTLYLPASGNDGAGKEEASAGEALKGTETILLVDDEPIVLEVSRAMLASLGYRVYTAPSGQEALALYTEKKDAIDLVILDMIMPGISGSTTFDQLREINPGVKVLLASSYSINGQAQDIIDRGCDGFIQKPFPLELLSQRVREVLDNKGACSVRH